MVVGSVDKTVRWVHQTFCTQAYAANCLRWCQQNQVQVQLSEGSQGGTEGVHGDNSMHGQRSNTSATGPFAGQLA
jgi:hypothetical protein